MQLAASRDSAAGFTLVEVLVTVFVVAVGLLTAAVLQAASKRAAFEAAQRTVAVALAQEMVERIRSNSLNVSAYITSGSSISASSAPTDPGCGGSQDSVCAGTAQVAYDIFQWWQALNGASEKSGSSLTGGLTAVTGCIGGSAAAKQVEVVIAWRGAVAQPDNTAGTTTVATCGATNNDYEPKGDGTSYRRTLLVQAGLS